jgi:hypothetical protein
MQGYELDLDGSKLFPRTGFDVINVELLAFVTGELVS